MNQKTVNVPQIFAVRLDAHKVKPPTREWKPLKVSAHPEQRRMDEYKALRSQYQ